MPAVSEKNPSEKNRITSEAERREFERNFAEKRPLRVTTDPASAPRKAAGGGKGADKGGGVNGGTRERLRRGLVEPQARIDLHGMTEAAAHGALQAFLAGAAGRGLRLVLVVTGKGNPRKGEDAVWMGAPHGVLKQMVPRWLERGIASGMIVHVQSAHARHGGGGALYVYLGKRR